MHLIIFVRLAPWLEHWHVHLYDPGPIPDVGMVAGLMVTKSNNVVFHRVPVCSIIEDHSDASICTNERDLD